jgi:hypothetical protein
MKPHIHELDAEQMQARLDDIQRVMGEETARPFRVLLTWYLSLLQIIQRPGTTLRALRRLLFGTPGTPNENGSAPTGHNSTPDENSAAGNTKNEHENDSRSKQESSDADTGRSDHDSPDSQTPRRRRQPGHGRTPAKDYWGCDQVVVKHDSLQPGDLCPHCHEGGLYRLDDPAQVVRLKGQPPVGGDRYELERLRCGLCGEVHTASLPADAGTTKYDASVASIVATLRYGQGMPWKRIEQLQKSAGVPLPASVQWEVVRDALGLGLDPVYRHLLGEAAQGDLFHHDDTSVRVLELTSKLNRGEPLREDDPTRYGVFTTNVLSVAPDRPVISLFFTGPRHAGENLRELLARRMTDLPPPLQMCDASSRNMPPDLDTIVANCLAHGRRNFVALEAIFPAEAAYVLACIKQVYWTDRLAQRARLSPERRLELHQERSGPVMESLQTWLQRQLAEHLVEPNSSLGGAIKYMLNHWEPLTCFLRVAGAPLDNNICERALKMAIRHRKNSLFYKTMKGAGVGDVYMSLIHTCHHAGADPYDYLTAVQRNAAAATLAPGLWLPWNYRDRLDVGQPSEPVGRAAERVGTCPRAVDNATAQPA